MIHDLRDAARAIQKTVTRVKMKMYKLLIVHGADGRIRLGQKESFFLPRQ
jgi:hypothetical protein